MSSKDNIKPANSRTENAMLDMSEDEFKRGLYTWFEDRGILGELRTHLRRQMISTLKGTTLGQALGRAQALSPKAQTINSLIAEFLLKNKHHLSLSVFSSEAPLLNVSSGTTNFTKLLNDDTDIKNTYFTKDNFWENLQVLGFSQNYPDCQALFHAYFANPDNSLLLCMIQQLSDICQRFNEYESTHKESLENYSYCESWTRDVQNLISKFSLNSNEILNLTRCIIKIVEHEKSKTKSEESIKYNRLQDQLEVNIKKTESTICDTISEMEQSYLSEKQKMCDEISEYQDEIKNLKKCLDEQHADIVSKSAVLDEKEGQMNSRMGEMQTQINKLKLLMKNMQKVFYSVFGEKMKNIENDQIQTRLEENVQKTNDQYSVLKEEFDSFRHKIQETRNSITKLSVETEHKKSEENNEIPPEIKTKQLEQKLLSSRIENLEEQNTDLRNLNQEQQRRLEDLELRNSTLMNDLQNSQITISILSHGRHSNIVTTPPLLSSPIPPPMMPLRTQKNNENGDGVTPPSLFGSHQRTPIPTQRFVINKPASDQRRKTPKRLLLQPNLDEGNATPTEEILSEARSRLRKLEQESEEVDRNYQDFKQRQKRSVQSNLNFFIRPSPNFSTFKSLSPVAYNFPDMKMTNNTTAEENKAALSSNVNVFSNIPASNVQGQPVKQSPIYAQTCLVQESNQLQNIAQSKKLDFKPNKVSEKHDLNSKIRRKNCQHKNESSIEQTIYKNNLSAVVHSIASSAMYDDLPPLDNISLSTIDISSGSDSEKNNNPPVL